MIFGLKGVGYSEHLDYWLSVLLSNSELLGEIMTVKIFKLSLKNGQLFTIITDKDSIDYLIDLIGENMIQNCEEL